MSNNRLSKYISNRKSTPVGTVSTIAKLYPFKDGYMVQVSIDTIDTWGSDWHREFHTYDEAKEHYDSLV